MPTFDEKDLILRDIRGQELTPEERAYLKRSCRKLGLQILAGAIVVVILAYGILQFNGRV